ncbi:winged helix-turn-helix domain-containing protein [Acetobacter persici]|uniref:Uncharacterized protein n=1 Tax=Acetobacter persici TaxID=1076596 RepID=A0A6V8IB89_9PROT|nr:winged helix-turn-helix domain-containing protein [Acetobacter persici]GFE94484.1 hypothetical protein DmAi_25430 [Acetobacter persici]
MSKRRWSKFWWQDYERDPALRLCSLAAQGLWMRLLCLMHEAEPYGYLCVNHRPLHTRQLAQMLGVSASQIQRLMAELREAGVYSLTPDGLVFCRRLLRDKAASDLGAQWGRTGGNPSLKPAARSAPGASPAAGTGGTPPHPEAQPESHREPQPGAGEGLTTAPHAPLKHQEAEAESEAESSFTAFGPDGDARTHLFKTGLLFLKRVTGRPERSCRALLGKWLKMLADDAATVLAVLAECEAFNPAEPVSWLEATIRHRLAAEAATEATAPTAIATAAAPATVTTATAGQNSLTPDTPPPASPHAQRMAAWATVPDLEGV